MACRDLVDVIIDYRARMQDPAQGGHNVHLHPRDGYKHENRRDCWCNPRQDEVEPRLWIHHHAH